MFGKPLLFSGGKVTRLLRPALSHRLSKSLYITLLLAYLAGLRLGCASAESGLTPAVVEHGESLVSVQPRQVIASVTVAFLGVGLAYGRVDRFIRNRAAHTPGLNRAPGSLCYRSGSWTFQQPVLDLADTACTVLTPHALSWVARNNRGLANPTTTVGHSSNGTVLRNEDGMKQEVRFYMFDVNGARGKPWLDGDSCVMALRTLLYDCSGEHGDTRGGLYFYGNKGVAGYGFDAQCVDRRCGSNT